MQILLGAHETIIKINSKSTKIDYIQHFINTNFLDRTIKNNYILIPQSFENSYHRIFLLKWLYTLYSKKTKQQIPELKESLVKRFHKKIKIELKNEIIHRLVYSVINEKTISIQIIPKNNQIAYTLKTFLITRLLILPTSIHVTLENQEVKELLKKFMNSKSNINVPHEHIYDKDEMESFFTYDKPSQKVLTVVDKAYITLEISKDYNEKSLKKQYKKLAKEFHPDRAKSQDTKTINLYTQKFQKILNAYEVLLKQVS